MRFGSGDFENHLIIELYSSGNIILTDKDYVILTLLRSHKYEDDVKCAVKEKYPFTQAAGCTLEEIVTDEAKVLALVEKLSKKEEKVEGVEEEGKKKKKQRKKKKGQELERGIGKKLLQEMVPYMSPAMAEHCLRKADLDPQTVIDETNYKKVIEAAKISREMVRDLDNQEKMKGYILYTEIPVSEEEEARIEARRKRRLDPNDSDESIAGPDPDELFKGKQIKEFICFEYLQHTSEKTLEFEWYDQCVDWYFTQIDKQKEDIKLQARRDEIHKKMNRIKEDQNKRVLSLIDA